MLSKAVVVGLVIGLAEVAQGILRVRLLNRRVGDHRARQIGVFTGSVIILAIAWLTVPWVGPVTTGQQLGVGGLWVVLMLGLEVGFGRLMFRASWNRIAADFDPRLGNLLVFGMLVLLLSPLLVTKLRGLKTPPINPGHPSVRMRILEDRFVANGVGPEKALMESALQPTRQAFKRLSAPHREQ